MPSNWERMQLLKRNAVVVKFEDLNQQVQLLIGHQSGIPDITPYAPQLMNKSLKNMRVNRGFWELLTTSNVVATSSFIKKNYGLALFSGGVALPISVGLRTGFAKLIQQKHEALATAMKQSGIIKAGRPENNYPPDWINPAIVSETHPIFSIQANGDMVFRRATPLEFNLLKIQQGWRGKAGLNVSMDPRKLIFRWRGTLRKPLAPETERKRVSKRLKEWAARLRPAPRPRPAHGFARKRKTAAMPRHR